MPFYTHFDGMGGCWGISHGDVKEKGEEHCKKCQYHFANRTEGCLDERTLLSAARSF